MSQNSYEEEAPHFFHSAHEYLDKVMVDADNVARAIYRMKEEPEDGMFNFDQAAEYMNRLLSTIKKHKPFGIKESCDKDKERMCQMLLLQGTNFSPKLLECLYDLCNGKLFDSVGEAMFAYSIDRASHPFCLTPKQGNVARLCYLINLLSKAVKEKDKEWFARILDKLNIRLETYNSKATFCTGSNASAADTKFAEGLKDAFVKADAPRVWL